MHHIGDDILGYIAASEDVRAANANNSGLRRLFSPG
jgi:hypothetical protein